MIADIETRPIRVLLVEDDEDDFVLTRSLLAESRRIRFELDWATCYEEAIARIVSNHYDLYLLDYRLGDHDGLQILREAKSLGCKRPIILLTGQRDTEIDVAAMEAGAADYLIKGEVDAQLLERSIRYALAQDRTLEALRESEERYALSARGANDGLWVWDLLAGTVYYSPRWKEMLGEAEEDIGNSPEEWFSRVHPDELQLLQAAIGSHRDGVSSHIEIEHRMRCRDGSWRWMLSRGLAVRDADGIAMRIAGSQTDITERKLAVERLTYDAFHDSLTGLPNRALFMDRLGRAMEAARRHSERLFAVLFLDLDRFKVVNDSLGHTFGDRLLISVAARLKQVIRSSDTVARLGGDEFTVLLEGIEQVTDAVRTAQRIHEALQVPFSFDERELFTTASIGIALSPTGYDRPEDVLRDADIAMYRAKARGKARHEVFDKTMHDRAVKLLQLETALRHAVDRDELRVHYQPIVSLLTGKIIGFEALLRWQRGDQLISAEEIVPVAEETGLILPIGEWVLREALQQLRLWRSVDADREPLHIHVNLSPRQFLHPNLYSQVERALVATSIDPQTLHLEVTESVLIENGDAAATLLRSLSDAKIRLSLDDFGTGYSSLSTLRRFPFDLLKIDRSFLAADVEGSRADEIVRTIGNLARVLGMEVTVEGLESAEQVERMRSLGIDYAQGFYFSRPVDAAAATMLLERAHPLM
ncbi:MAG TPA: EAL domain-containing protein [Thermoanaerobaculia bacterium]|jgi:diguanylate cyclase (GGDEF)-like protein/PAS domain S-box-containing protein|nr:EAL domain-containing protein [Thermoanaerobaculia bacterium]